MKILGIDPGVNGAAAIVAPSAHTPRLIDVIDLPTIGEGSRHWIDVARFTKWIARHAPNECVIEVAAARPDQSAPAMAKYLIAFGMLYASARGFQMPVIPVMPQQWKRHFGLLRERKDETESELKRRARLHAIELFATQSPFAMAKHEHRAEAALIAAYGAHFNREAA